MDPKAGVKKTIVERKTYYRSGIIENKTANNECLWIEQGKDSSQIQQVKPHKHSKKQSGFVLFSYKWFYKRFKLSFNGTFYFYFLVKSIKCGSNTWFLDVIAIFIESNRLLQYVEKGNSNYHNFSFSHIFTWNSMYAKNYNIFRWMFSQNIFCPETFYH